MQKHIHVLSEFHIILYSWLLLLSTEYRVKFSEVSQSPGLPGGEIFPAQHPPVVVGGGVVQVEPLHQVLGHTLLRQQKGDSVYRGNVVNGKHLQCKIPIYQEKINFTLTARSH